LKYTVIWQSERHASRKWIEEEFGPYISNHIYDGRRELVLDDAILVDDYVYARPIDYYARFSGKRAFMVHFGDEFYEIASDVYKHFRGVFHAYWADVFDESYIMKLPLGYTSEALSNDSSPPIPASRRKYVWSFLGEVNKSSRPDMARELSRVEPHFFYPTDRLSGWTLYNSSSTGSRRFTRQECAEVLRNSTFAPAPMGNANIESYRLYEALEESAIPIVEKRLTLDYYRELLGDHPIPTVRSWAEARKLVGDLVKSPARLDELQLECRDWWGKFKRSYSHAVGAFLEERSLDSAPRGQLVTDWGQTRIWRGIELLRHHDRRAGFRRIVRQVSRLAKTGRMRVAWTQKNPVSK